MQVTVKIKTNTAVSCTILPLASIFSGTLIKWKKKNEKERGKEGRKEERRGRKEKEKEPE